ncbi:MAG: sigma factor-like helix-turn-helix DNA-binding protein [Candidatus Hydrothermarchaeaceae archaeon]
MKKGLGVLTERQAEIVRLNAFGYTQEEISKLLNISQPRVSSALKTAGKKIEDAKETVEFYEEVKYLGELKKSGYRGEAVLK